MDGRWATTVAANWLSEGNRLAQSRWPCRSRSSPAPWRSVGLTDARDWEESGVGDVEGEGGWRSEEEVERCERGRGGGDRSCF